MPDHVISPELFDLLDEYVAELETGAAIVDDVVPQTSPMLAFIENAFAQFFQNQVGREIKGFDEKSKRRAARQRAAKKDLSPQTRSLIVLYQQFCDSYEDIQSASYGGQATVLEEFHIKLMVRLIERIRALAGSKHDDELRSRADAAFDEFAPAVDSYDWQQHERENDGENDE
jgi:hypothetical protein